jgi:hypothetical protein
VYPPATALSDAVFATPARLVGGPAPLAPAPPQPEPKTRKVRPDLEYLAGGDRWGTLGGYLRSLPAWIDSLTFEFGPDLYDRMQLDDQVSSSLRALVYSVLSDDLVLRPGVDKAKDPDFAAAKQNLSFMERATWEGRGGLDEWLYAMARGALGGGNRVSETVLGRQESGRDAGKMVLGRLAVKPRRAVSLVVDAFNRVVRVAGLIPGRYGPATAWGTTLAPDVPRENDLPREKFCIASWDPPDGDPRGAAVLRCVYEPWWAKLQAARDWLANLAQFGSPSLVGTTAPGADSSAATDGYGNPTPDGVVTTPEQDFLNQIIRFRNGSAIVIPAGATLEALTTSDAGKAFATKVDACDRAIAQGILLAMRAVMQSRFGSRADAEQGQDVAGLQTRFCKRWLARMVSEDLLRYIYRVNYGPNADPRLCPYASLSPVEHQDLGTTLVAVSGAWKNGLIKNSQLPWVYDQFGMPPATEDEMAAPPPGGADPGGGPDGDGQPPAGPRQPPQAPFAWDESKHPRGQPENAGEFGPGGGGAAVAGGPVGFEKVADADRWGAKEFAGWESSLDGAERFAVEAYTGGGYEEINAYLRGKHSADMADARGKTAQVIRGLDSALSKGKAPAALSAYRGVRGDADDPGSFVKAVVAAAQAGGTLTDQAFMSTSLSGSVAEKQFAGDRRMPGRETAVVRIHVPGGSPGAYSDVVGDTGEAEWLMPRGTTLRLRSAVRRADGVWDVEAEVERGAA